MKPTPLVELIDVNKRFGRTVTADHFSLAINEGEFFTFLGPSGSGKSTILRMVAGLEDPDSGRILYQGQDLVGVPPWKRGLGMMFQQYAIFPHMTVAENVAYGLRARGRTVDTVQHRVQQMLEMIGLQGRGEKNATLLSGGEQQRVALARALAPAPAMLLLDEPLSALDEKIRREMQLELKRVQRRTGTTFFYVTHDQEEALTMSDRVAVLNGGRCVQCDRPEVIFTQPRTRFVAQFFRGCNVIDADIDTSPIATGLHFAGVRLPLPAGVAASTQSAGRRGIAIRCENLRLGPDARAQPVRFAAVLEEVIYKGTTIDHCLRLPDDQRIVATDTRLHDGAAGQQVTVGLDPDKVVLLED